MPSKNISATIEESLLKRMDRVVQDTERTRSWLIAKAVESYLDELEDAKISMERLGDDRLSPSELRRALRD